MDRLEEKYSGVISKQEQYNAKIKDAEARIQELKQGISAAQLNEQAQATAADKAASAETRAANESSRGAAASKRNAKELSRGQIFANGLRNAFTKLHKVAGGLVSRLAAMHKHTGAMHSNILKMSLAMLSIRSIWGAIRQIMSAALSSNQQLQNQLTAIKGVFGQAFLPIINTLISGLSYITTLADRIYQIFSGVSLISKYNASQMKSVASSTGAAAQNAKSLKKQLAGFDELNVLSKNDTVSGSGAGSGSVATFEPSKLSSKVTEFINKLKALYNESDFEGIGILIGNAINKGLQKINDAINWDNIGGKINECITAFTTAFNSLIDAVDWELLGDTISKGINTIVNTLYLLFTQIDFAKCGQALGKALNGLLHGVDWKKLGITVSTAFRGALAYLINAVETFDWKGLGKAIADFIQGIDWVGIISDLARLISDVLVGAGDLLCGFVEELDWAKLGSDLWNSLVGLITNIDWSKLIANVFELLGALLAAGTQLWESFKTTCAEGIANAITSAITKIQSDIESCGGNVIEGLKKGISDAFSNIWQWIKDNIFQPFIDGFCSVFGIHSPSTIMAEMGEFLIEGLKAGIGDVWAKVKEKFIAFWISIKDYFKSSGFNSLGNNIISGIKSGIGGVWSKLKEKFSAFWTSLKSFFTAGTFNGLGSNIVKGIKSGLGNVWSSLKEKFSTMWTSLKNYFKSDSFTSLGKNIVYGIRDGISQNFNAVMNMIKSKINGMVDSVKKLLGIHSPSRVFRDEVGQYIGLGIGEGISNSIPKVVKTAATLTDAIANQFDGKHFKLSEINLNSGVLNIGNSLFSKMQAITQGVNFAIPTAVNLLPYQSGIVSDKELWDIAEWLSDDMTNSNMQISQMLTDELRRIIGSLDLTVNVDDRAITDMVIKEIKRRTLVTKKNPLLT